MDILILLTALCVIVLLNSNYLQEQQIELSLSNSRCVIGDGSSLVAASWCSLFWTTYDKYAPAGSAEPCPRRASQVDQTAQHKAQTDQLG